VDNYSTQNIDQNSFNVKGLDLDMKQIDGIVI